MLELPGDMTESAATEYGFPHTAPSSADVPLKRSILTPESLQRCARSWRKSCLLGTATTTTFAVLDLMDSSTPFMPRLVSPLSTAKRISLDKSAMKPALKK